jgi:hypothetical protein
MFKPLLTIGLGLLILGASVACRTDEPLQANAGEDFAVQVGESPAFDGCASTGDVTIYKWTIVEAPSKMADDAGKVIREMDVNCSFTLEAAMGVDEAGDWVIELEVKDGKGNTSTDTVRVTVVP